MHVLSISNRDMNNNNLRKVPWKIEYYKRYRYVNIKS